MVVQICLTLIILIWLARLVLASARQIAADNTIAGVIVILGDVIVAGIVICQIWIHMPID